MSDFTKFAINGILCNTLDDLDRKLEEYLSSRVGSKEYLSSRVGSKRKSTTKWSDVRVPTPQAREIGYYVEGLDMSTLFHNVAQVTIRLVGAGLGVSDRTEVVEVSGDNAERAIGVLQQMGSDMECIPLATFDALLYCIKTNSKLPEDE